MVERAIPVISETSLIPPRPKLRASAAASNRRPRSSGCGARASYRYLIPSVLSIHNIWRTHPHCGIPPQTIHATIPCSAPNRPGSFRHPRERQEPAAVLQNPGQVVGPETSTAPTSTRIHRPGHSSAPRRQRQVPHPAGSPMPDFEATEPSTMQVHRPRRKAGRRTPSVISASGCAHQKAGRRSIKKSTQSDSVVLGRTDSRDTTVSTPDFVLTGLLGQIAVEATTANPPGGGTPPPRIQARRRSSQPIYRTTSRSRSHERSHASSKGILPIGKLRTCVRSPFCWPSRISMDRGACAWWCRQRPNMSSAFATV